jgi:FMN phosphatase YigB (HAD superfamily)
MLVVFDLDGTLSDPTHREHHAKAREWDKFHAACGGDAPKSEIMEILYGMRAMGHRVEIWTGRWESARETTLDWLYTYGLQLPSDQLLMREDNDFRPDTVLKGEWIVNRGRPRLVFEDRDSMVKYYRGLGITCVQVAPGDF